MSSLTRRIQRSQPNIGPIHTGTGDDLKITRGEVPGRKYAFNGRGSKLGHTNPKATDLLARKKREAKRNQQKGN